MYFPDISFLNVICMYATHDCELFLQPDDKYEFSEPTRIQNLVKNYSQFISFPIYTWQEKSRTIEVSKLVLRHFFELFVGVEYIGVAVERCICYELSI